jgi:membrane protein
VEPVEVPGEVAPPPQPAAAAVAMTSRSGGNLAWHAVLYLLRTEVHTFAFSVAANALLSFFPFVLLLLTLTRHVFHSPAMYDVVLGLLRDNVPAGQDFVVRNFNAMAGARHRVQALSLVILLFTSTGVFVPLEVALNQVWGFPRNRPYWRNQLVSFGLAFGCGVMALLSVALTVGNIRALEILLHGHAAFFVRWFGFGIMKGFAIAASIGVFFLIYWALPNGKVPPRAVLPAAVIIGLCSEVLKNLYLRALPWLNFQEVYGPFALSISLVFWAFLSGMLLLAGAYISAEGHFRR